MGADELVDVVNENDEVVGQEMKSVCHDKGIWHRVSAVLLTNSEGKIWLQTREKNKLSGGLLDFSASGHVGKGDGYEESAYREMEEELGVRVELKKSDIKVFENYAYPNGKKTLHVIELYVGKHDGPFEIQEDELEGIGAYSIDEIKELMKKEPKVMTMGLLLVLKEYLD